MSDPYEYYAVGAPRPRSRPVLTLVSSRTVTMNVAAVCVAIALVAASVVHIGFLLAGAFVAMVVLASGAWVREGLENERDSDKAALVAAGYLVTNREVAQCHKKDRGYVEKARSATALIAASNAATDGWLGDIDFAPDLFWIATTAVQASAMNALINKLKPSRRPSDKQAAADGKQWLDAQRSKLDERVKLLEEAAKHARSVDDRLARQKQVTARLALRSAEAERVAALRVRLIGTQHRASVPDPGPDAAEAIRARAEAFYDVDDINRRVADEPVDNGGGVIGWFRRLVRL
ncbi:hypothetical protein [Nocardia sp. 348MFTsu5.1]|uniref:hypothetical protein n=1 Tax=Nocardia sp. 348MFTsu5.1 TaxID=1172185 RepID=UPI00036F03F4|nr:hypothetical protein [Nocardia sp. 348MFTsu5.1]